MESRRSILAGLLLCLAMGVCSAQRWTVGTNVVDYVDYGTVNLEGSMAVGQHWSATAVAKLNPFHFQKDGQPVNARQQLYGAGVRFWPWHVYSGWWAGARVQYQEYNRGGGRMGDLTDEGDRVGLGLSGGFSYMLTPHLNLDMGAGFWGGYNKYTTYSCPVCGLIQEKGERAFFLPNDMLMALVYVF